jgi:diguanylate cyclase (GGDEF)-like protein
MTPAALQFSLVALSGLLLLSVTVLGLLALKFRQRGAELQAASEERGELMARLKAQRDELDKLKVGLKTHLETRETLAETLRAQAADVNLLTGKVQALSDTLQRVSPLDALSGLLNAEHLRARINDEWARMLRDQRPITLLYVELDDIESFKDTYGAQAWESCVKKVGAIIARQGRRPGDCAGRLLGAKFAMLLPGAGMKNGIAIAERIKKQVVMLNISNLNSPVHGMVTASLGVATMIPSAESSVVELQTRADGALYEARFRGGNGVVQYRSMTAVRLERWDRNAEGEFSTEGLIRKLALWGYTPNRKVYEPGASVSDRRATRDIVDAVIQGQLRVSLEGETQILRPGDCLFIPKGLLSSVEVVSETPVVCIEGEKAA